MDNNISWLEKYRPKILSDYYISKKQLDVVKEWIKNFRNKVDGAKPFLILHGSAGIGKTTLAYLILQYYNYEIIECNASDTRTKKTIQETLGQVSKVSVCIDSNNNFKETAILMDEIDGLNGGEYNSVQEIIDIVTKDKDTKTQKKLCPVVCTCNSIKNKKLQILMKYSVLLNINKPSHNDCKKLINKISSSTNENFIISDINKDIIIEKAFGDYRQIIMLLYEYHNSLSIIKPCELQVGIEANPESNPESNPEKSIILSKSNKFTKFNDYEDDIEHFQNIKIINNICETPLEKINYILTNNTKLEDIQYVCSEDANIYYMNLYINIIPIIYELQLKKNNITKENLLVYYKKLYTIYELLKTADLLNNKIFIDKKWELLDYFECIGISIPLQILHNTNVKHILNKTNKYQNLIYNIIHNIIL